jgi:hypothetical protein
MSLILEATSAFRPRKSCPKAGLFYIYKSIVVMRLRNGRQDMIVLEFIREEVRYLL